MQIDHTPLPGLLVLTPRRFGDDRGWFSEVWNRDTLAKAGLTIDFVQDNHSMSTAVGTLRGLHFQSPPRAQAKLVRCGRGHVWDVAVDVRRGSPTYGRWFGTDLTAENGRQMLIPAGFLHGFVTRAPESEILYKCSDSYAPDHDGAVRFDTLGIDWGIAASDAILSDKDRKAPAFADFDSPFVWEDRA